MEKLTERLNALKEQGYESKEAISILNDEITALARAEYMRMCNISSLSPEELDRLDSQRSTDVTRWLENIQ